MQEPVEVLRGVVHPWHMDHFGHMNVRHYAPFFDDAVYHLWTRLGLPYAQMLALHRVHMVTVAAQTQFLHELTAGDLIVITGRVARIGTKSCALALEMRHADTATLHARYDVTEVVFDPATRRSAPMPAAMRAQLDQGRDA
ncbi:MAG: acyl-CoA thioesterase [Roseinatronobacter sp.]